MKITVQKELGMSGNLLVLGLAEGSAERYPSLHKDIGAAIEQAITKKTFQFKWGDVVSTTINHLSVVVLGLGKKSELTLEKLRRAFGKAVKEAKSRRASSLWTNLPELWRGMFPDEHVGMAIAEGLLLGNYYFSTYLAPEKKEKHTSLQSVTMQWSGSSLDAGLKKGRIIAESANFIKDLVNESAGITNSLYLEKAAREVAVQSGATMKVLNKADMEKLGMGALLGVNAGSDNPPKLIFLEYKHGGKEPFTALVGKGITFDSGGYNIKPTKYIEDMKSDMAGAAAVLGTIKAAAALGVKRNIVGVMALCENMVSAHAQHPGDIVTAYNGKTIEIGNTDAEGRLVLADALSYTQEKYNPNVIVDLATLTGACVVSLGYYAAGMMSNNDALAGELKAAGEASGDRVWPLPLYEEYMDWMDGTITDLNNISQKGKGYEAGSITAAVFLSKFLDLEKTKWAHLDIAGSAYWYVENDYVQKYATGSGVRVLSYWLLGHKV